MIKLFGLLHFSSNLKSTLNFSLKLKSKLYHELLDYLLNLFVHKILQQNIGFKVVAVPSKTLKIYLGLWDNYFLTEQNLPCKILAILYISILHINLYTMVLIANLNWQSFVSECLNSHKDLSLLNFKLNWRNFSQIIWWL